MRGSREQAIGGGRRHNLPAARKAKPGCRVFVNTGVGVRGEPIARTPKDALCSPRGSGIEVVGGGNRDEQRDPAPKLDCRDRFDPN